MRGKATWLCDPPKWTRCTGGYPENSLVAAAGSELRKWLGKRVTVCRLVRGKDPCVRVRLVDTCACKADRIIDLYAVAFRRLAPQSAGVIDVRVYVK